MKICPDCGTDLLDVKRLRLEPGDVLIVTEPADGPPYSEIPIKLPGDIRHNKVVLMQGGLTVKKPK